MEYTRLGSSGLKVSRIALGCMSFGDTSAASASGRSTTRQPQPIFRQAVELGITFWDTANVYELGTSEEIVGRAIDEVHPPRGRRAGHQGVLHDARRARRVAACPARRSWSRSTPR